MIRIVVLLSIIFTGCNSLDSEKSKLSFYKVEKKSFNKYINATKDLRDGVNLQEDKHLINRDYPIEISLYKDGKWYYNLDNLGEGNGTWSYNKGKLELFAERILFDMHINIEAIKEDAGDIVIKFSDRFGPRTLQVEKLNFK